jgi:hypothetical protein
MIFITSNKNPKSPPSYLYTQKNSVVIWKVSNVDDLTSNKYTLLETLIRRLAPPKN